LSQSSGLRPDAVDDSDRLLGFGHHPVLALAAAVRDRDQPHGDRIEDVVVGLSFEAGASNVEFGDYLRALCANIDPQQDKVTIEVETDRGALLPLDRAVAAGLIVNELVTNALKYAFDEKGGAIRVTFTMSSETGEASLAVEDNGRGMGPPRKGGLGLTLIDAFTRQLDGQVEQAPVEKGTRTCVRFPLPL